MTMLRTMQRDEDSGQEGSGQIHENPVGQLLFPLRSLMATFALATARAARMFICMRRVFTAAAFTIAPGVVAVSAASVLAHCHSGAGQRKMKCGRGCRSCMLCRQGGGALLSGWSRRQHVRPSDRLLCARHLLPHLRQRRWRNSTGGHGASVPSTASSAVGRKTGRQAAHEPGTDCV
jgi:hypothetical protein